MELGKLSFVAEQCDGNYPTPNYVVYVDGANREVFGPICSAEDKSVAERIAHRMSFRAEHKHIQWFVIGAVKEWNDQVNQLDPERLLEYTGQTVNVVLAHLTRGKILDGTCTDLQCTIAIEAARIFK